MGVFASAREDQLESGAQHVERTEVADSLDSPIKTGPRRRFALKAATERRRDARGDVRGEHEEPV
jgi:hypothetical protein